MQREIETTGMVGHGAAADAQFGAIYAAHRVSLFRFAVLVAGDAQLAEEVTAEVFSRVLTRWRAGAVTDALPYLRRAIVNELRSRFRRRGHERRALQRVASRVERDEPRQTTLDAPLMAALMRLPVRQRAVVVLRFHDDLSEAEVARAMGCSVGTVKSQASRGLAQLREMLEDEQ